MSFASIDFAIFFIIVIVVTLIIQKFFSKNIKQLFLFIASYFFYGYWDWRFCFLLLFITLTSYFSAKSHKKMIYGMGIAIPLIVLGFFKYFNFFLNSFFSITHQNHTSTLNIILPIGISFYTFQALSYVIDVHRGKIEVENNFIKLALYLSFFPQLVAGPIIKAHEFLPQLEEDRKINLENFKYGIQLITFGLFKKIVLADHIALLVDDVFFCPSAYHWTTIILAVISYSIQIYFDFSGYSDIAIGCAKCLGYDFNCNFNLPYISQNITEFWRRWHISLSTWLKEYIYIPLGGNRKGKIRQSINLLITMLLGGLWHGANWTFIFWGALNGIALCIHKRISKNKKKHFYIKTLNIFLTFTFISFTWIFFRADNFSIAWDIIKGIFTLQQGVSQPYFWSFVAIIVLVIFTICAIIKSHKNNEKEIKGYYPIVNLNTISGLTTFFTVLGLILGLAFTGEQPFVYFQF